MVLQQVLQIVSLLDDPKVDGSRVCRFFRRCDGWEVSSETVRGQKGSTDFIRGIVPGSEGASRGGDAPTLGLVGRLGGVGARPHKIGLVSDADGAICVLSAALKLAQMHKKGDVLPGDVMFATHICPDAPIIPHEPVPFMGAPVDMETMNKMEIDRRMDAVLSADTTKGNYVVNHSGMAITPTVKEGYILPVSDDLLQIVRSATGAAPVVLPLSQADITPYESGLEHINSIMQPATATCAAVVGVAITAQQAVAGCATGASREWDIAQAAGFVVEVARQFCSGEMRFYSDEVFSRLVSLYGPMNHFQGSGQTE